MIVFLSIVVLVAIAAFFLCVCLKGGPFSLQSQGDLLSLQSQIFVWRLRANEADAARSEWEKVALAVPGLVREKEELLTKVQAFAAHRCYVAACLGAAGLLIEEKWRELPPEKLEYWLKRGADSMRDGTEASPSFATPKKGDA